MGVFSRVNIISFLKSKKMVLRGAVSLRSLALRIRISTVREEPNDPYFFLRLSKWVKVGCRILTQVRTYRQPHPIHPTLPTTQTSRGSFESGRDFVPIALQTTAVGLVAMSKPRVMGVRCDSWAERIEATWLPTYLARNGSPCSPSPAQIQTLCPTGTPTKAGTCVRLR
jgi:hypothetical protein